MGYSNAYVKRIEVKSQNQLANGDYEVAVAVDIESQKLIEQLKELQIVVIENAVDQDILSEVENHFDKEAQNQQTKQNFKDLVEELLISPIKEHKTVVHIDITGKLQPIKDEKNELVINTDTDEIQFTLPVSFYMDNEYIKAYRRVLQEAKPTKDEYRDRIIEGTLKQKIDGCKNCNIFEIRSESTEHLRKVINLIQQNFVTIEIKFKDKDGISFKQYTTEEINIEDESYSPYRISSTDQVLPDLNPHTEYDGAFTADKAVGVLELGLTRDELKKLKDIELGFKQRDY
ncbi:hypothetical protein [Lonepinella sp. BR2271]|uniref:hypothetical protein n=1 Tax=Lonepinella sp. BR2271 TaxID=3434550 RepID=UPI003F6E1607